MICSQDLLPERQEFSSLVEYMVDHENSLIYLAIQDITEETLFHFLAQFISLLGVSFGTHAW